MKHGKEIAIRYAKALFHISLEKKNQEKVFSDLRALEQVLVADKTAFEFLTSISTSQEVKKQSIEKACTNVGLTEEAERLVKILAARDRLAVFSEIVQAFQALMDTENKVARGLVRSATELDAQERKKVETMVEGVLKKKVVLSYKVEPSLIGGLVAQVGSYVFDDTLNTHLKRIHEDLKRRTV